jgi:hypothetical protein
MADQPVTDPGRIVDVAKIIDTTAFTANPTSKAAAQLAPPTKPTINTLILYDATISAGEAQALQSGYYPKGTLTGVRTWKELTLALGGYSFIRTLVLFFRSVGGQLIFEDNPAPEIAKARLTSSATQVTGEVKFEGCNIMLAPVTAAYLVSGIVGSGAAVSGYTHYSLFMPVAAPPGLSQEKAQDLLNQYAGYWIPGTPTAAELAASNSERQLWVRYFRELEGAAPLPPQTPGASPPSGFVPKNKLKERIVKTGKEAVELQKKERAASIHPPTFLTVRHVAAVAKFPRP